MSAAAAGSSSSQASIGAGGVRSAAAQMAPWPSKP
jgi:hypothetical protein